MAETKKIIGRPFKKGQSGNPSGRPKVNKLIQEKAREHGEKAVEYLVSVLDDENEKTEVRRACANDLLDRGYGKPHQSSDVELTGDVRLEEIRRIIIDPEKESD